MRVKSLVSALPTLKQRNSAPAGSAGQGHGVPGSAAPGGDAAGSWPWVQGLNPNEGGLALPSAAWLERCSGGRCLSRGI